MRRHVREVKIAVAALAAALGSCGSGPPTAPEAQLEPAPAPPAVTAPCFDATCLHDTRLELDPSAWQALRDGYRTNDYFAADLRVDGTVLPQVGVRSRGGGTRNATKPGLKVDLDRYVPGQSLQGYGSLVLDNLWSDPCLLRERLAFAVFEAMGFPAPRNAFTRLTVNGEYWGLYALVEPVARPFLARALGEREGQLFEYEWAFAWDFSWRGPDVSAYVPVPFKPEWNEDDPRVGDELLALVRAVNEPPDGAAAAAVAPWLDPERLLAYVAVENAIAEADGFLGEFGMNNFYLYQLAGGGRFVLVPWDKDASFVSPSWPLDRNLEANRLVGRLVADPARRALYEATVLRAVSDYVNPRWLGPRLDTAWEQVRDAALADERKAWTNAEVEAAVAALRHVIASREGDVRAQARGARP